MSAPTLLDRPAGAQSEPSTHPIAPRPTSGDRRGAAADLSAALVLASFSGVVAAGFARVFAGWQFLDNLLVIVVVGHGAGLLLRRLGVRGWLAVPALALVLTWLVGAIHYRFTYSSLLPTADTWSLFQAELELVRSQFRTAVAPVIYAAGWDVVASISVAVTVFLADTFAFRALARAEALVPGGVLFVFIAALGEDRLRIELTVALVLAGALTTVVLRAYHGGARRLLTPAGVVAAAAIAAVAGLVGPNLPGAYAEEIYDPGSGGGGGVTEVVSPLVDIRSRLTNRSDTELFVVQANLESYWRSSALPRFDGTTWGLPERPLRSADGTLGSGRAGAVELRQRVRVVNLGGALVPAAPDPIRASPTESLRWNADVATLVHVDGDLGAGDVIDIVSASPRFDPATLAAATSTNPGDPIYFELPSDFPESVRQTAVEVTADASTPYEIALALQFWFRDEFTYSTEVQAGHGSNAIEAFLRDRVGYCEQFAGTYAAMMRSLGVPARVAVGFTPGNAIADGSFSVLGKHAHAWPEVWFDGLGWVAFEPTPGRGAPGGESYTQVAPEQDDTAADPDAAQDGDGETPVPTTVAPPETPDTADPNIPAEDLLDGGDDLDAAAPASSDNDSSLTTWAMAFGLVLLAALAPAVVRRLRRRRHGESIDDELQRIWRRAEHVLRDVGVGSDPARTPIETAELTAARFPIAARPIRSLAEAVTSASFRREGTLGFDTTGAYGSSPLRSCRNWCTQIERAVRDSSSWPVRLRRYFTTWG